MAGSITKPKKPKSKRTPVRLRHKIQKASAAKQRKAKKEAKKNPQWTSKLKKDPGIPNLFPYKEKLLNQIEEDRIRKAEEQKRRKEMLKAAKAAASEGDKDEDRMEDDEEFEGVEEDSMMVDEDDDDSEGGDDSNPLAALIRSARKAAEQYDKELESGDDDEMDNGEDDSSDDGESGAIEVPGGASSRKAFDKVFKQVVDQADVVLYVLDARDPEGTRSRDVEKAVMAAASGGKRLIFILNKVDLIPPPVLRAWLAHLRRFFPTLPLRASNPAPNAHVFNHRDITIQSTSSALFKALKSYAASRNLKRAISVGVIGYPNVGKSSVINALLSRLGGRNNRAPCPAGAEAGVTTSIRAVKIDQRLTLLDSPGIVFPSTGSISSFTPKNPTEAHAHLVLLNAVPPKQIDDPVPAVTLLLKRLSAQPELLEKMIQLYDLPPLLINTESGDSTTDFLVQVARKRGRLGRGGVPNIQAAAMTVVTDWRDGRIQGWSAVPAAVQTGAPAPSAKGPAKIANEEVMADQKKIVTEWAQEFNLEGLWASMEAGAGEQGEEGDNEVEMQ